MTTNTTNTTPFTIPTEQVEEQIAYGSGYITAELDVNGFWGTPVTIRIKRDWHWGDDKDRGTWIVEVSHSSGGTERGVDSLAHERNLAVALLAACDYAEELRARSDEMEAAYQRRWEAERAAREKVEAEKAAKIEADAPITANVAKAAVDAIREMARVRRSFDANGFSQIAMVQLIARFRGEEHVVKLTAVRTFNDRVVLRRGLDTISRKDAIDLLTECAAESLRIDVAIDDKDRRHILRTIS